jgi:hypothetical protein
VDVARLMIGPLISRGYILTRFVIEGMDRSEERRPRKHSGHQRMLYARNDILDGECRNEDEIKE